MKITNKIVNFIFLPILCSTILGELISEIKNDSGWTWVGLVLGICIAGICYLNFWDCFDKKDDKSEEHEQ